MRQNTLEAFNTALWHILFSTSLKNLLHLAVSTLMVKLRKRNEQNEKRNSIPSRIGFLHVLLRAAF